MAAEMTFDEFRGRMYHSMKEKGHIGNMKAQFRNAVVTEMHHMGLKEALPAPEPVYDTEGSLLLKAANSVVADHLKRIGCEYSLSIFLPETGNTQEKIFTTTDLLQLLKISPHSRIYKQMVTHSAYPRKGFLWTLICELAALHGTSAQDTGVQTDIGNYPPIRSLEDEFKKLDAQYSDMGDKNHMFMEERILSYQHQLEERAQNDIQQQVAHFKENELTSMRMEERETHRKELEKLRKEMDRTYQTKLSALSQRERHSAERLQKMQEMQEKETFNQRQQILNEIESIRGKEVTMRRQQEIDQREKSLWEDKIKSREELIKRREDTVRTKELEVEQKVNEQIRKFKLEEQARTMEKFNELEIRQARVKDDERRLYDELHGLIAIKDELKEKKARVNELEAEMIQVRHEAIKSEKNNEILSERVRSMADYPMLKDEHNINKREIDSLKERISDLQKDNMVLRNKHEELLREMTDRAGKPTPELYFMQQQMEKVQNELKEERTMADHQRRQADTRLQEEIDRNKGLIRKFEEQSLQMKEMGQELHNLRDQLGDTTQALTNEVYRRPHQSMPGRADSLCDMDSDAGMELDPPGPVDPAMIHTHATPANLYSARAQATDYSVRIQRSDSDDYSYDSDLVKETKNRLKALDREAERLDKNYQNFHNRMTTISTYPTLEQQQQSVYPLSPSRSQPRYPGQSSAQVTPTRSRVTFQDNLGGQTMSPAIAGSRNVTGATSASRLPNDTVVSSTPSKPNQLAAFSSVPASQHDLDTSMSTVHTSPDRYYGGEEDRQKRPLSMNDLEPPRLGSPSIVVIQNSESSASVSRAGPSGAEGGGGSLDDVWKSSTQQPTAAASLDDAWRSNTTVQQTATSLDDAWKNNTALPSLDDAWKSGQQESDYRLRQEEERRRQEEEDREFEERRRQREEERKRKDAEARERERQALLELEQKESGQPSASKSAPMKEEKKEEKKKDEEEIDPVMQKYMAMVLEQRAKEKAITEKTLSTWKKGHQEHTPEGSELELSIADDEKEKSLQLSGPKEDDDFW